MKRLEILICVYTCIFGVLGVTIYANKNTASDNWMNLFPALLLHVICFRRLGLGVPIPDSVVLNGNRSWTYSSPANTQSKQIIRFHQRNKEYANEKKQTNLWSVWCWMKGHVISILLLGTGILHLVRVVNHLSLIWYIHGERRSGRQAHHILEHRRPHVLHPTPHPHQL